MAKYELTDLQVENLKALIMDANIKGSAATAVAQLLTCLDNPDGDRVNNDLHSEHNNEKPE